VCSIGHAVLPRSARLRDYRAHMHLIFLNGGFMTDALKAIGRGLGYFVLILAMIGAGLKMAAWMGMGEPVSASVSAPEQQA